MSEADKIQAHFVPGLNEALLRGNSDRISTILSSVKSGEIIKTWGIVLLVDNPTPEEQHLLTISQEKMIEYGLIRAGDTKRVLVGKTAELDKTEVMQIATELSVLPGKKTFSHTHWDNEYTPIPSGAELETFRQLSKQWGYKCRVVSWLPGAKTFEFIGDYLKK